MGNGTDGWRLGRRAGLSAGEVAWEVFGEGPPVVLVHGTPSRSYIWRDIVPALAERHSVYAYDLLGYGESEKAEGQDVSILGQARLLEELVGGWGLDGPAIAGHDIGGGIVLGAHLVEGVRFARIALLDAVTLSPWLSQANSSTWHIAEHREAYATMPEHFFEAVFSVYLEESGTRLSEGTFETFLSQWRGEEGQGAFVRQAAQLEERHTTGFEPRLASIEVPVQVIWGEADTWLDPEQADRLHEAIPGSRLKKVAGAGHFVMEDAPREVAEVLVSFFSGGREGTP